jgi:acetyl-CoA acetyltransferase family protein
MRPETTTEILAKLKAVFKKDGVVTAGNASGITDGASMMLLTTAAFAKERGLKVLGRLVCWAAAGCDPKIMGIGPVPATERVLKRYSEISGSKKDVSSFKRVEVNEAFAAQYLAVEKVLGLKRELTNVEGGAIALGHPLAASGTRLTSHLLYTLKRLGGGAALASACIGGGQGMSVVVEVD